MCTKGSLVHRVLFAGREGAELEAVFGNARMRRSRPRAGFEPAGMPKAGVCAAFERV